jgi:hypothetical protein
VRQKRGVGRTLQDFMSTAGISTQHGVSMGGGVHFSFSVNSDICFALIEVKSEVCSQLEFGMNGGRA